MQTLSQVPQLTSPDTLQRQLAQRIAHIRRKRTKLALRQWQAARLLETLRSAAR